MSDNQRQQNDNQWQRVKKATTSDNEWKQATNEWKPTTTSDNEW